MRWGTRGGVTVMRWGTRGGVTVMRWGTRGRGPARRTETLRVLRKLRPREVKCPSWGRPAHGQSWGLHTGQQLQGPHPRAHHVGSSRPKRGTQHGRGWDTEPRGVRGMLGCAAGRGWEEGWAEPPLCRLSVPSPRWLHSFPDCV